MDLIAILLGMSDMMNPLIVVRFDVFLFNNSARVKLVFGVIFSNGGMKTLIKKRFYYRQSKHEDTTSGECS